MTTNQEVTQDDNVFAAPQAELEPPGKTNKAVLGLDRTSTLLVVILVMIFGIYTMYWILTRASAANTLCEKKQVFMPVIYLLIGLFIVTLFDNFGAFDELDPMIVLTIFVAYLIAYWVAVFNIRTVVREIINGDDSDSQNMKGIISAVLTFLLGPIYLQYKINRAHEAIENHI